MLINIRDCVIDLSDWTEEYLPRGKPPTGMYCLRVDKNNKRNTIGFLFAYSNGSPYFAPRFFGEFMCLLDLWRDSNLSLLSDLEKNKQIIDKFLQNAELWETFS